MNCDALLTQTQNPPSAVAQDRDIEALVKAGAFPLTVAVSSPGQLPARPEKRHQEGLL